jgi:hypothetical protein
VNRELSLKQFLERRIDLQWSVSHLDRDFQPTHIRKAAAAVEKTLGDLEAKKPADYDLAPLHQRIHASWRRHGSLRSVSARDLRRLPWVLFFPAHEKTGRWLGADSGVVRSYGQWLSEGHRSRAVIALLHEFLRVYPAELETFEELRALLRLSIQAAGTPSLRRWKQRCADYHLLDEDGDRQFVEQIVASETSPSAMLQAAGLDRGLDRCRFLASGTEKCLQDAAAWLRRGRPKQARLARFLAWLEADGILRFETLRIETACALLEPFVEKRPEADVESLLREFFLRCLGDPRLPRSPGWAAVPTPVRHVLTRWLVKLALDDFFRLLDKTALDRHWRYRKSFWMAYLQRELITDAWVVLGPQASKMAQQSFEQGALATGRLRRGGGVQRNQSVLLLRLPGMTVAEWSHNGTCRMWLDGNRQAPQMYQSVYSRADLIHGEDFAQRHHGTEHGSWQRSIADWVGDNIGTWISAEEYMPKRVMHRVWSR